MDLDRLHIFVKIVDAGSMSAAARLVHLTQPALSRNLRLLEDELGTDLFDRVGRRLVLTPAGRALLPRARALLSQASTVARDIERIAGRQYFDLRVGTVDSVATFLFPRVVAPLREAFPDLAIKLTTARTADLLRRVATDELDLVIVASSGVPPVARATRVGAYDLQFWGRSDRFGELARATTDEEVARFPLVEIESLPGQPTMIPEEASTYGVANSLASVKALVMAGFGVGAMLGFMLDPDDRAALVSAAVPHDPDCALYVGASPHWGGGTELAIEAHLVQTLASVYPSHAEAGCGPSRS